MNVNLLSETLAVLERYGKTSEEVQWCGSERYGWFTWPQFANLARVINYDSGYGWHQIPQDLVVVGTDWWLERAEYDGAEWWVFKSLPVRPQEHKLVKGLRGDDLEEANREGIDDDLELWYDFAEDGDDYATFYDPTWKDPKTQEEVGAYLKRTNGIVQVFRVKQIA